MTTSVSGGGGGGYPGVTSDGAQGIIIAGALQAGNPTAALLPSHHQLYGWTTLQDSPGNVIDSDSILEVLQGQAIPVGQVAVEAVSVSRTGSIAAQDYASPMVHFGDHTATVKSALRVDHGGATSLEVFSIESLTGALSTVTDAAAKAVLTSIIAAITGIKVATNNTT